MSASVSSLSSCPRVTHLSCFSASSLCNSAWKRPTRKHGVKIHIRPLFRCQRSPECPTKELKISLISVGKGLLSAMFERQKVRELDFPTATSTGFFCYPCCIVGAYLWGWKSNFYILTLMKTLHLTFIQKKRLINDKTGVQSNMQANLEENTAQSLKKKRKKSIKE